jgi:hypothetical protein
MICSLNKETLNTNNTQHILKGYLRVSIFKKVRLEISEYTEKSI